MIIIVIKKVREIRETEAEEKLKDVIISYGVPADLIWALGRIG